MGAHPSGWVPGAPPWIWTFLSSLGEKEFFHHPVKAGIAAA
jgi:hypothetical protein